MWLEIQMQIQIQTNHFGICTLRAKHSWISPQTTEPETRG